MKKNAVRVAIAGAAAGFINGIFGAGGGMVLVPLLTRFSSLEEAQVFSASVSMILPVCLVSLAFSNPSDGLTWNTLVPYLIGGFAGGLIAGPLSKKIPTLWLHRILGILILWGGIRNLC